MSGRSRSSLGRRAFGAVLLVACSQAPPSAADPPSAFIANAADFSGFRAWRSIAITTDIAPGDSHLNGPRHVFYNRVPPPGSTRFPVGTILVKQTDSGPLALRSVFAMVKRGGDYDPSGARNWEWFQLANLPGDTEAIVWRGPGPSGGAAYGSGPLGGCTACHGSASETDYVMTPELEAMIGGGPEVAR